MVKECCVKESFRSTSWPCGPSPRRPATLQGRSKTMAPRTAQIVWEGVLERSVRAQPRSPPYTGTRFSVDYSMDGIMRVCFLCSSFCFNRLFACASYQKCIHTLQLARWVPRLLSQTTLIDAGPNFKQSCTMSLHELRFCLVHDIRLATALAADITWS